MRRIGKKHRGEEAKTKRDGKSATILCNTGNFYFQSYLSTRPRRSWGAAADQQQPRLLEENDKFNTLKDKMKIKVIEE